MKLWPFYDIAFETSLSPEGALRKLHEEIGPETLHVSIGGTNASVPFNTDRRMFLGTALADGGQLRNNLNSEPGELRRHGFQASIRVRIRKAPTGSLVVASLRLSPLLIAFQAVWCIPCIVFTAAVANAMLRGASVPPAMLLAGPGLILLVWLLLCFSFSEDAETADRMLRATLERE
jgi:hypothetical protein